MLGNELPNLDALLPEELDEIADDDSGRFSKPFRRYAECKARAMGYRASGKIQAALAYETECELIYEARLAPAEKW